MTKEELEKEAEEWVKENMDCCKTDNSVNQSIPYFDEEERCCAKSAFQDGAEFGYNKSKAETALLSQHILDLQKDKGNLTDRVRELEQQIEKMKCCGNCIHCKYDENEESYEFCEKHQQVVNIAIVPCSEYERR